MGSPITFSGFNQIDFNVVLNAVMQQESQPLTALQTRQQSLTTANTAYSDLATRIASLQSAAAALSTPSTVFTSSASSSDAQSVAAVATATATLGRYDVVVSRLASAQVMASATTTPDDDTTTVATGGSLTIGGTTITLSGSVTLQGLANAINAAGASATASVVETSPGAFRLVLNATDTGAANAFTVTSALTGSTLGFPDDDLNGVAGDSEADNAVQASNAALTVNGVAITSTHNSLSTAVPGVTLTLLKADSTRTISVGVTRDDADLVGRINEFVSSYNDLTKFAATNTAAGGALVRDSVVSALRTELRSLLTAMHGSGAFTSLAEIGIGFSQTGELTVDSSLLSESLQANPSAVSSLFADPTTGVFAAIGTATTQYTQAGGLVPSARARITTNLSQLAAQISDMQGRLAIRRRSLQAEYTAADQAMSRLNAQTSTLSSLGASLASLKANS